MKKIFIVLLLFSTLCSFSQNNSKKAYVVKNNGDTLRGNIINTSGSNVYRFCKFQFNDSVTRYTPAEIKSYRIEQGRIWQSGIEENSFVEVLVEGKLSLYYKQKFFYLKKGETIHRIQKLVTKVRNGREVQIESNKWRGVLKSLISDELGDDINLRSFDFSKKYLVKIVNKYNAKTGEVSIEYNKDKKWSKKAFGFKAGVNYEMFDIKIFSGTYDYFEPDYSEAAPYIGLVYSVNSPRLSEKIDFDFELLISKIKIESVKVMEYPELIKSYDNEMEFTTLSLPVIIKYNMFGRKKSKAFWGLGANLDINLQADQKVLYEKKEYGSIVESRMLNTLPDFDKIQMGLIGEIGFSREFKKFKASLAVRYNRLTLLTRDKELDIHRDRFSVGLTIFKL